MINEAVVAENVRGSMDLVHIESGLPLYLDEGNTRTETVVMELKPMASKPGFSIVLSNGEVYEVRLEQVR